MFTLFLVVKGKDRSGRTHDYVVWRQNEFRNGQRMSMGTHLKLDIRTSYLTSPLNYQQVKNYFPWDSHGK